MAGLNGSTARTPTLSRVSVIVPTKNERHNLPRLLATIPPEVEVIVCDASDDGTPEVALAARPENTRILRAVGSIAAARQEGAEASRGDLLVFTDADVELNADYFERALAGCVGRDGICGPKLSRTAYAEYYRAVARGQGLTYALLGLATATGSNMAMGRAAFGQVGGFRPDLTCNEDTELFLRAGRLGLRVAYDDGLVVWATDHRRLRRGLARKSVHSVMRNVLLYLFCRRSRLPRLLYDDWGYWSQPSARTDRPD